jgi:hypothetical protein
MPEFKVGDIIEIDPAEANEKLESRIEQYNYSPPLRVTGVENYTFGQAVEINFVRSKHWWSKLFRLAKPTENEDTHPAKECLSCDSSKPLPVSKKCESCTTFAYRNLYNNEAFSKLHSKVQIELLIQTIRRNEEEPKEEKPKLPKRNRQYFVLRAAKEKN